MTIAQHASKGGKASVAKRQALAVERRTRAEVVWRLVDETDDLSPAALAAALMLIERLTADPDCDPLAVLRLANAAEIVHRISRLASGQSTANIARRDMTDDERREQMARLRAMASDATREESPAHVDAGDSEK
jgi:ABC-type branched-subunit amino acid transport system ATPase component